MPALERQWSPDHRRLSRWQRGNTNQLDHAVLEKEFNQANIESLCLTEHIDLGHFQLSCPLRIKARPHRLFSHPISAGSNKCDLENLTESHQHK